MRPKERFPGGHSEAYVLGVILRGATRAWRFGGVDRAG